MDLRFENSDLHIICLPCISGRVLELDSNTEFMVTIIYFDNFCRKYPFRSLTMSSWLTLEDITSQFSNEDDFELNETTTILMSALSGNILIRITSCLRSNEQSIYSAY